MKLKSNFIFGLVLNSCLGAFIFGYSLTYLSVSFDTIYEVLSIPSENQHFFKGLSTCLVPLGSALGSIITGYLLTMFSRRKCMIQADCVTIIGSLLQLIPNTYSFLIGRVLVGLSVGINSGTVPIYIREFSPVDQSGQFGSFFSTLIFIGMTIGYAIGLGYTYNFSNYWRLVFSIPIFAAFIRTLLLILVYKRETPVWYFNKQMHDECEQTIKELYKSQYVKDIIDTIYLAVQKNSKSYIELFQKKTLNQTVVGTVILVLQQLNGVSAINFYAGDIFKQMATFSDNIVQYLTIFLGIFQIIAGFLCGYSTKYAGRKSIMLYGHNLDKFNLLGLLSLGISFIIISIFYTLYQKFSSSIYSYILVLFIYLFVFQFGMTIGPISWVFCAEVLNEKGFQFAVFSNRIVVALIGFIFPLENEWIGFQGSFLGFSIICLLGRALFVYYFVIETKNLTASAINQIYQGSSEPLNKVRSSQLYI